MPPPNSSENSFLKCVVHHFERRQQPLARFAVEVLDALAEALDRLDQVVALLGETVMLGLDLAQLFLGAQIDGAEPLALAADAVELGLDVGDVGQLLARLDLGKLGDRRRLDFEHLADLVLDVGEAAVGTGETFLGARGLFTRGADGFERGTRILVGGRERILGFRQPVGGGAALGFGGLDLADQRGALLGEGGRARR